MVCSLNLVSQLDIVSSLDLMLERKNSQRCSIHRLPERGPSRVEVAKFKNNELVEFQIG